MNDKAQRTPILEPLVLLFKSRRFLTAVIGVLVTLLIYAVPGIESIRVELTTVFVSLALAVIGGLSWEDAAKASRDNPPGVTIKDNVAEITEALLQAFLGEIEDNPDGAVASTLRKKLDSQG